MKNNFNYKYIVYQTINIVNNKIYVGIHKVKDPNIFCGYIGNGVNIYHPSTYMNPKYPFQYAVKKYGTSNFRRSTLFIYDTLDEALKKEGEIVTKEFVEREDTYNVALGGGGVHLANYYKNKIYQFNTSGELLKEWEDIYEVANFLETWKESIYSAINKKSRLYGFYWSYSDKIDVSTYSNPNNSQKVYKYTKNGGCVAVYDSINIAAKENGYTPAELYNRIKEGALTKNYYYSLTLYDEYKPKSRTILKGKMIYVYDISGNFEAEIPFENIHNYLGLPKTRKLSTVVKSGSLIKDKQLRLEKFDKIDPYIKKNSKRTVLLYKMDGTFVKEFDSVRGLCKEMGLDNSSVGKVLRGVQKSTKGYTIKYKDKIKDIV